MGRTASIQIGCICGYYEPDWQRIASDLQVLLRKTKRDTEAARVQADREGWERGRAEALEAAIEEQEQYQMNGEPEYAGGVYDCIKAIRALSYSPPALLSQEPRE